MKKLIYGVGIMDADYPVIKSINVAEAGRYKQKVIWKCPFYQTWWNILVRCYSAAEHKRLPSYIGCSISEEWKSFMVFRKWMLTQDWEGKQLDKDLLFTGNKQYNKDTCIFVSPMVNKFIADKSTSTKYPLGVAYFKQTNKLQAGCRNPFSKKREHLGLYELSQEDLAHNAWKARKHKFACILADQQLDHRVADALKLKYK